VKKSHQNTTAFNRALITAAVVTLALGLPMASASAGFLDMLFGGYRRPAPVNPPSLPSVRPSGSPSMGVLEGDRDRGSRDSGPSVSYCVRLCDGHPFPVQSMNSSAAQACSSLCPAAQTKVFSGGSIDSAVSSDGKRYSALPTAFVYRKQLVGNCTCNGKSPGGLAQMDVKSDPTMRPGDFVATNEGLMVYQGGNGRSADFAKTQDRKLANVPIRPSALTASALAANARAEEPRHKGDERESKEGRRRHQR
jgi:hypothetical protein